MKLPLLETLLEYHNENNLILSMPGNKCGKGFLRDSIGREFVQRMGTMDITEVEPLDNLHCPEGVIMESQKMLAEAYNAERAFFLVNGSSSGNISSIFSAFNEGDEVIIERNCHKSVYNAIILRKLKVTYIEPVIDPKTCLPLPVNEKNILEAVNKCTEPKGIILTYPNYFGISYDVENVIRKLKKKKIISIIDAAHGSHYGFNKKLPKSPAAFGDYVILSAHKTLPALTQGAYLIVNRKEDKTIETYISMFTTTSPSYLIMGSLDYARHYIQSYGKEDYDALIDRAEEYKKKINSLKIIHILSDEDFENRDYIVDKSRYVMMLPKGYSGEKLLRYLRSKKIQCEMSFSNCVVLILSPFNNKNDFERIYNSVVGIDLNKLKEETIFEIPMYNKIPKKMLEPFEALRNQYKLKLYKECVGKTAMQYVTPYPPGIPLICPGELIDEEIIESIEKCLASGHQVIGINDDAIKILDL